jgi:enoyl reductase
MKLRQFSAGGAAASAVIFLVLSLSGQALAQESDGGGRYSGGEEEGGPPPSSGGGTDGDAIIAEVEFSNSIGSTEPPGTAESVTDWEPPPCWYEPRSEEETREYVERILFTYAHLPPEDIGDLRSETSAHYIGGQPYENYNLDRADEGDFYFGVVNPSMRDHPDAYACSGLAEWAETPEALEEGPGISAEVLAEAAYEWLPLPETEISLNPDADVPQTVNLPTWVWQETADIGEVSATARLDEFGLEATTVATPSALTLRAGTGDATLHPDDGQCTINADGTIGEPYTEDRAEEEPPCGITYRRATADGEAYELTATITWSVSWTGTGNPEPQELPDAVLETTQEVTVQEVQTIVR